MPAIIKQDGRFIVRAGDEEWTFDTHAEAQEKANAEMMKKFKKSLTPSDKRGE